MATDHETDTPFGQVSRVRGTVFKYMTFLSSVVGLVALGVLLAYVAWDAFGLATAEPLWYVCLLAFVGAPVVAFTLYARRNPLAGEVTLEAVSTAMGGLLAGFAAVVVLEIIAGPSVWFAYFVTVVAPIAGLLVYGRARSAANWIGLGVLGTVIAGPVVGTLLLGPLTVVGESMGGPGVYVVTLVLPAAAVVRYVVDDYLALGNGTVAAVAVVAVAFGAIPVVDSIRPGMRSAWMIFLVTFFVPTTLVVWKNLADPERWAGFVVIGGLLAGIGLLVVVPDVLGIAGPSPWFGWDFVTSAPSRFPEKAGLYPAIIGSVFIIVLVAVITLVVGVGAAVYLEEYAPTSGVGGALTRLIRINISNLAGVPSVVYGILGLAVFANLLGLGFGTVITASFTLSLLILPIVIISARESISAVPDALRSASYGMGATRWQTTRNVVIPRALPGIFTGTILALGRAIGETAPLIMIGLATTRFSPPSGLFSQTSAMPMQIFAWSDYARQEFQHGVVAAGVVTLLIVLLTMNAIAILLRNKYEQEAY